MLPWHLDTRDVEVNSCCWIAEAVSWDEYVTLLKQKDIDMVMEEGRCE